MLEVIEALDSHAHWEGEEVEVRLPGGAWDDMRRLLEPFITTWAEIGQLCNTDALDPDEVPVGDSFIAGRSSLAHEILRRMAAAEAKVQDR
jgi:hypothetical protein